jgi:flavorubredoxin
MRWCPSLGTSYNAYLIEGSEKTALLDTVDPTKLDILLTHLKNVKKHRLPRSHHAEQDHSGSILRILQAYRRLKS